MNIILKDVKFVSYDPDTDEETDVRPLTRAEAEELWQAILESSGDNWHDEELEFAGSRTDGKAHCVSWEAIFIETPGREWRPEGWSEKIARLLKTSGIQGQLKAAWKLGIEVGANAILIAQEEMK